MEPKNSRKSLSRLNNRQTKQPHTNLGSSYNLNPKNYSPLRSNSPISTAPIIQ